ncbi:MAG: hypothetical protein IPH83_17805 [Gammaproteobacteria bacterium]|nr:hypothetical protein [Gammaproteobacteria bacterium]
MSDKKVACCKPIAAICQRAEARHGVEYLFGQSNPPAITLAADDAGIKQIGYRQEKTPAPTWPMATPAGPARRRS